MNPDYINNSLIENTLNKFAYPSHADKFDSYLDFKKLRNNKMYGPIVKTYNLNKPLEVKYLGSLPYDHGKFNDREHYNTYYNKNYIPPSSKLNKYPDVGVLSSIFQNR